MRSLVRLAWLAAIVTAPLSPALALAQESGAAGGTRDVVPVAAWTIVTVVLFALVGTVFYLFKRRIGGFPANPAWKAPITIMPSKDFADEGAFGDAPVDAHH